MNFQPLTQQHAAGSAVPSFEGSLAVSIASPLMRSTLVSLLRSFRQRHPRLDLNVLVGGNNAQVSTSVLRADAAFGVRYCRDSSTWLATELIGRDPIAVVCAPDHELAGLQALTREDVARYIWLGPNTGWEEGAPPLAAALGRIGIRGVRTLTVDDSVVRKRMVQEHFGIGLFTAHFVRDDIEAGRLRALRI